MRAFITPLVIGGTNRAAASAKLLNPVFFITVNANEHPESIYRMCKDSIAEIKACLFSAKSTYTEEQKHALQRDMNLVTAKIDSLINPHSATTASTSSTSSSPSV
ncbi:MAG: hypothetical protein P1U40_00030 [Coxiellaceae bacterium]|nr:hypothetical protein [Coxiellaceae bacterium]